MSDSALQNTSGLAGQAAAPLSLPARALSSLAAGLKPSPTLGIMNTMRGLKAEGQKVYSLGFGESPFPVPAVVAEELRVHAARNEYLPAQGLPELREAVAAFLNQQHSASAEGAGFEAEDVVIGPGSKDLMFHLQAVIEADLVLPSPSWVSYEPQARLLGRRVVWVPPTPGRWKLDAGALERTLELDEEPGRVRLLALNYPQNPTGLNYTRGELEAIAAVCRRHSVLVMADEIYFQLTTDPAQPHVSMASVYPEGTVVVGGMSKSFGAGGWRLGHMAFPRGLASLRRAVVSTATSTYSAVCTPVQLAAIRAYRGGPEVEAYIERSRVVVRSLTAVVRDRLVAAGVRCERANGAFYVFPDFEAWRGRLAARGLATGVDFLNRLVADTGVAMLPGSAFGLEDASLTARLCVVDFDGAHALEVAARALADGRSELSAAELAEFAAHQLEAIDVLLAWLGETD